MTDEERREAERLADNHAEEVRRSLFVNFGNSQPMHERMGFIAGYAAACDAKREDAQCEERWANKYFEQLEAERARSAKLIEAIKRSEMCQTHEITRHVLNAAIAEYRGQS